MAVGTKGMLCTSSYEARLKGVRSAMPGFIGLKLCPELQLIKPNFHKLCLADALHPCLCFVAAAYTLHPPCRYSAASHEIEPILGSYDPEYEMASLDEAYLDVTEYLLRCAVPVRTSPARAPLTLAWTEWSTRRRPERSWPVRFDRQLKSACGSVVHRAE